MGLFAKKEDVPSIPPAPTLPALPEIQKPATEEKAAFSEIQKPTEEEKKDLPELPSFPANPKNDILNQEIVKSAVADLPSPEENEVNVEIPKDLHISEEPKEESLIPPKPSELSSIPELPKPVMTSIPRKTLEVMSSITESPITKQIEPIFVRIDKFQGAQKNFEQIKNKVKEIEAVLKKIKDVKMQEEMELKGWADDIEQIKARLVEVDTDIFEQI